MIKILRQLSAKIQNTFVAECPCCHKPFYGKDGFHPNVKLNGKHYRYVCEKCMKEHSKKV